jgi:hypothetical protein
MNPDFMLTLSAAYAECGDYEEAVRWAQKAISAYEPADKHNLMVARALLNNGLKGMPYRTQPVKFEEGPKDTLAKKTVADELEGTKWYEANLPAGTHREYCFEGKGKLRFSSNLLKEVLGTYTIEGDAVNIKVGDYAITGTLEGNRISATLTVLGQSSEMILIKVK